MTPLAKLYSGPGDLLAKVRRDRDALLLAVEAEDETSLRDKLFDFSVTAYHVVDWVRSFHPNLEEAVYSHLDSEPSLQACRDLANSSKHFALNPLSSAYRNHPPSIDAVDHTIPVSTAGSISSLGVDTKRVVSVSSTWRPLKVAFVAGQRVRVEEIATEAVSAWERFFAQHGIAP